MLLKKPEEPARRPRKNHGSYCLLAAQPIPEHAKGRSSEGWEHAHSGTASPLILPPSGGGAKELPKHCILVNWIARPMGRELGGSVSSETKKETVDLSGN